MLKKLIFCLTLFAPQTEVFLKNVTLLNPFI